MGFTCSSPWWILQKQSQFEVPVPAASLVSPHYPHFISASLPPSKIFISSSVSEYGCTNNFCGIVWWKKSDSHSSLLAFPSASLKKKKKDRNPNRGCFCICRLFHWNSLKHAHANNWVHTAQSAVTFGQRGRGREMLMLEPLKLPFLATVKWTFALLKIHLQREPLVVWALPWEEEGLHSGLLARSVSWEDALVQWVSVSSVNV